MTFTLQTRMSEVFKERPELRELLPAFHPAFERLSHPVLGKLLPRMVTVEDAARIAGVDALTLLGVVNGREAHRAPPIAERVAVPAPPWLAAATPARLDLRPMLARGEEPFPLIRQRSEALRPGEVLTLIADFEPAPLFRLFGARGWRTHGSWEGGVFLASFERPITELQALEIPDGRLTRDAGGARLDLRGLEPPGPLQLSLAALEDPANLPLTLVHHREPVLLFPRLAERGLRWELVQAGDHVEIHIVRP